MRKNINYSLQEEPSIFNKLKKLNDLSIIIKSDTDDFKKAILMRRIFPNLSSFKKEYYYSKYNFNNKKSKLYLHDIFSKQEELIKKIESIYSQYESLGLFEKAKKIDKFLLRQARDIDSRDIIINYINDENSYDLESFLHKNKIRAVDFESSVKRVKNYAKDIYEEYLKTAEINKVKKLVVPMYNIFQMIEGINTGKTIEGNKFDKYEFYKLAPFKGKDFDLEIRNLSKDYPKLSIFKNLKQKFRSEQDNKTTPINYANNLYLFTLCFTNEQNADLLKNWMDENNIKNLTPIFRSATTSCYLNGSDEEFFGYEDANEIFDIIEERKYPKIYEVYNLLKEEKIKSKKLIKENK